MLAADSMLQTSKLGLGIPRRRRIDGTTGPDSVKLGFRTRSAAQEQRSESGEMDSRWWLSCFRVCVVKGKKAEVESIRRGEDLWDAALAAQQGSFPEHLVVMVNGLVGSADDWRFAAEQFVKKLPDKVFVHRSECNSSRLTFDGVDLMGERLAEELPFLCGLPFLERRASETAHLIVGRTGKHLFLTDNDDGKPPLLLQMVDDCDDIKFRSALHSFKRRVAYANANFDHMVGWRTSSIRHQRELPKHHLLVHDEKYPHVVYVDKGYRINNHNEVSTVAEAPKDELEEEMIRGLKQVSWERVDVSFQKSRQRYIAHNTIQVKSYWLNSDGADVIFHMIDNFLI
ncbi:Putative serine esterase (DUF676) [Musa troglodytarum]|uniref:Serine esterase (DUF676) n=1 Tax=Musa troglodytarum TaxID=320322 RepID=A0A9E7G7U2_9LILI|nr:Putative serine esterase (DUF676) [Musa troglodytarum]